MRHILLVISAVSVWSMVTTSPLDVAPVMTVNVPATPVVVPVMGELVKDVPKEDVVETHTPAALKPIPNSALTTNNQINNQLPSCRAVGDMCTYHSDCCSNACLGYLKRCVSG